MRVTFFQILSAVIIILGVVVSLFYLNSRPSEVYSLTFEVSNVSGFDLNNSALTFGKIVPGSVVSRYVSIENDDNYEIYVEISSSKNLLPFLRVSENEFFLLPGEKKVLEFSISVPKNSSMVSYRGNVFIKIRELAND